MSVLEDHLRVPWTRCPSRCGQRTSCPSGHVVQRPNVPPGCVVLGPDVLYQDGIPHTIQEGGEMGGSEIDRITFTTRQLSVDT